MQIEFIVAVAVLAVTVATVVLAAAEDSSRTLSSRQLRGMVAAAAAVDRHKGR